MELDTVTIRLLAAIERERDETEIAGEAVIGAGPMTSDGLRFADPPAGRAASCD